MRKLLLGALLLAGCHTAARSLPNVPAASTQTAPPVLLLTDLSHPNGDPDDHMDLAVAAGANLNVIGLGLEAGAEGTPPADQISTIENTNWPRGLGTGTAQFILDRLQASTTPVTIVSVGSLRDLAAAWRMNPTLMAQKTKRIIMFAGDAAPLAPVEYNVSLDTQAYLDIMSSGLPIRWAPCFDGGLWQAGTRSTFVQTEQARLFPASLPDPVEKYFSYRMRQINWVNPAAWVWQPVDAADRQALDAGLRNVWAGGLILSAILDAGTFKLGTRTVGQFVPTEVRLNGLGQVDPNGSIITTVEQWRVLHTAGFRTAMINSTVAALMGVGS